MQSFSTQFGRVFRGVASRTLRVKPVGHTVCRLTNGLGLESVSRRLSRYAKYVPERVGFEVGGAGGQTRMALMFSGDGNDHIVRSIWTDGLSAYEPPLPHLYARAVRGARNILDVGTNSGLYAILAAVAEPGCHVHCFEPFPPALHWLKANIRLNGLEGRVTVAPKAAGAEAGTADLFVPAKVYGETLECSASLDREFRKGHSQVLKVEVTTLDEHVRREGIAHVDVLRADVESAEHLVLGGATEILEKHRPLVLVEVLTDAAAERLEPLRARHDYRCLCLLDDRLVELPGVSNVRKHSNQLWYAPQDRDKVLEIARDLNMPLAQS